MSSQPLKKAIDASQAPFKVRNRIAHDMDVKFGQVGPRNRLLRKRDEMVRDANRLLAAAEELIVAVDAELA